MGLLSKLKDARANAIEHAEYDARLGDYSVVSGRLVLPPDGLKMPERLPIGGAVAEYESGADAGGRTTLTRVAAGAIIAGPVGAIVGGMFKKDRNRVYVSVTLPDGRVVVADAPAKGEKQAREFAQKVNAAGAHYPQE